MELFTHAFSPWREKNGTRVVAAESAWKLPLKWNKAASGGAGIISRGEFVEVPTERPRVFPSLCDPFEDWQGPIVDAKGVRLFNHLAPSEDAEGNELPDVWLTMSDVRRRLFSLIDATPNLDWLLLTKRPENIGKMMPPTCDFCSGFQRLRDTHRCQCGGSESKNCRPNLWLGTSVENQATADERIPHLLRVPAAARFLSVEPLLGPVDLRFQCHAMFPGDPSMCDTTVACRCRGIDWVIIGGESGPGARPCRVEWIRDLVRQCREAGVPCFVKQLGSNPIDDEYFREASAFFERQWGFPPTLKNQIEECTFRPRDRKGGDPSEWSLDLRVRELPR